MVVDAEEQEWAFSVRAQEDLSREQEWADALPARAAEVCWVSCPWLGRLGIIRRPRGGEWLVDEVRSWLASGLDLVVSLLTPDEVMELHLGGEAKLARENGLEFHAFPIPNCGVPEVGAEWNQLMSRLAAALERGSNVAVHCHQGLGRSALVVLSLLVCAGQEPDEALRQVEAACHGRVLDTTEQRKWALRSDLEAFLAQRRRTIEDAIDNIIV
jgi:protein-tyrosine phosphatase